jgi:hypothetical protein
LLPKLIFLHKSLEKSLAAYVKKIQDGGANQDGGENQDGVKNLHHSF